VSVDEMLAADTIGYEPVGLVTGSSVFEIPLAGRRAYYKMNMEVTAFTYGLHQARIAAIRKMRSQTIGLKADGVVGSHFGLPSIPRDGSEVRFTVTGTAMRAKKDAVIQPRPDSRENPFTSTLSGQDFALLGRAGYLPLGIVMGVCVFHVGRRHVATTIKDLPGNEELSVITEALYQSRELAMFRMQEEATALEAHGIVGVTIEEKTHAWGSRVMEFLALGSAVELVADTYQPLGPALLVQLSDRVDTSSLAD
jgi:uncharacterized protein YbjQ (UPF0145 family)